MPTYVYRLSMDDPADHDEHRSATGPEGTVGDYGEVEAALVRAVEAFARESGVDQLAVREPEVSALPRFGLDDEGPVDRLGPTGLFPSDQRDSGQGLPYGFHDGAVVSLDGGLELVRAMLRGTGVRCRLEVEDTFTVHVGRERDVHIGSDRPCERALARSRTLKLHPRRVDSSPYAMKTGGGEIQRPADDAFWSGLGRMVSTCRAGILEEMYVGGASRLHRLTWENVQAVRERIVPRARLAVWPAPEPGEAGTQGPGPDGAGTQGPGPDGAGTGRPGADGAGTGDLSVDGRVPLLTAVMPDADGVVRARWRTEATPGDRRWAFLRTLRRGQIVSGTVTRIPAFGVTFVDIGGFEAMINIPELSWRRFEHPCDVVSVGEEVRAEILDIELLPERVSLSLKALHEDPMRRLAGLVGSTVVGPVTKVVPFGVFVRVEEAEGGLEGLVHTSELADERLEGQDIAVRVGDVLPVRILGVDPARRRIALSHRQAVAVPGD
ncbi:MULTISPECIES: S1 RNA-binding domain-containing protein [unclassified Streptomyces]|uniref:S1 RNA-binding domain-containing protein n=1 Tax=unclassified Streptomyces TaxID=2593676 RepID=UPI0016519164|nr:S1 RNA-binding domain-containing protein [Streptomyces sp. AmelKG-D3]